jgi:hypothetical protein
MNTSVVPALLKAHSELGFDVQSWFDTFIRPELLKRDAERLERASTSSRMPFVASR